MPWNPNTKYYTIAHKAIISCQDSYLGSLMNGSCTMEFPIKYSPARHIFGICCWIVVNCLDFQAFNYFFVASIVKWALMGNSKMLPWRSKPLCHSQGGHAKKKNCAGMLSVLPAAQCRLAANCGFADGGGRSGQALGQDGGHLVGEGFHMCTSPYLEYKWSLCLVNPSFLKISLWHFWFFTPLQ